MKIGIIGAKENQVSCITARSFDRSHLVVSAVRNASVIGRTRTGKVVEKRLI